MERGTPLSHLLTALLAGVALVAALCLPRLAAAQAVLTLTPQDCVYRQGDDLAWASPSLDD